MGLHHCICYPNSSAAAANRNSHTFHFCEMKNLEISNEVTLIIESYIFQAFHFYWRVQCFLFSSLKRKCVHSAGILCRMRILFFFFFFSARAISKIKEQKVFWGHNPGKSGDLFLRSFAICTCPTLCCASQLPVMETVWPVGSGFSLAEYWEFIPYQGKNSIQMSTSWWKTTVCKFMFVYSWGGEHR